MAKKNGNLASAFAATLLGEAPQPASNIYLDIKDQRVVAIYNSTTTLTPIARVIRDLEDWNTLWRSKLAELRRHRPGVDLKVMCSGAFKNPRDHSSYENVIALAHELRSGM